MQKWYSFPIGSYKNHRRAWNPPHFHFSLAQSRPKAKSAIITRSQRLQIWGPERRSRADIFYWFQLSQVTVSRQRAAILRRLYVLPGSRNTRLNLEHLNRHLEVGSERTCSRHRMADEYEYQPLPDEESVRVLILSPGKGDEPLSGVLKMIRLSNRRQTLCSAQQAQKRRNTSTETEVIRWAPEIPYEAISYVWGSDTKDHVIFLDGKTHRITNNLSVSLHQCRLPDQSRALWADSICIDQDKIDEKSHQVYMMGRIYASSQRTLICLGYDYQDHARDASALTADVNKMLQETLNSPDFSWELNCFPQPLPGDPLVNDSRWQSIDILCLHAWFSRGWVIQEAALGPEAIILWAGFKLLLSDATRADMWYSRRANSIIAKRQRRKFMPFLLQQVFHQRQKAEARVYYGPALWVEDCDILFALDCARVLGLCDPRDRIFAFMALPFAKCPMPILHPNYNRSHLELYQDFIIKYLEETSDLNLLCYASHGKPFDEFLDGAPGSSWVPRWDHPHWNLYERGPDMGKKFGQDPKKPAEYVISLGGNGASASLQVRAVIFDSIRLVSPYFKMSTTIEDLTTFWSYWSKEARSGIDSRQDQPSFDYESLAFLTALCRGAFDGPSVEEWVDYLKSYSRFLWNNAQDSEFSRNPQVSPGIQLYHRHLMRLALHSRVFLLERGHYGLASWAIKQHDVCAFIFGVRSPIILRQVPDAGIHRYKVIGPASILSKRLGKWGVPRSLNRCYDWMNWNKLRENEGWTDWGLEEEKIILL